jgi:hypothetical protein
VVCIANINREMDEYLAARKGGGWNLFRRRPEGSAERLVREAKTEEHLSGEEMRKLEAMQGKIEQVDTLEAQHPEAFDELEEKRDGLMGKFFRFLRGSEQQHKGEEAVAEMSERLDADVKQVLKKVHLWLEKLPADEKMRFRRSPEFVEYKALLQKYGLVKAKEEAKAAVKAPEHAEQPKPASLHQVPIHNDPDYPDLRTLRKQ